uniref:extracellular calcium-sensing receptor-like n=1 Tax=Myxine glutinosa TaxID=7769 RepID=UPI00358F4E66
MTLGLHTERTAKELQHGECLEPIHTNPYIVLCNHINDVTYPNKLPQLNLFPSPEERLLYYLKKVTFSMNKAETLFFDKNGDPPAVYEIVNWQKNNESALDFKVVGIFDSSYPQDQQLSFLSHDIVWNDGSKKVPSSLCSYPCQPGTRKAAQQGEPLCCHDCIACPQGQFSNETVKCDKCSWQKLDFQLQLENRWVIANDPKVNQMQDYKLSSVAIY